MGGKTLLKKGGGVGELEEGTEGINDDGENKIKCFKERRGKECWTPNPEGWSSRWEAQGRGCTLSLTGVVGVSVLPSGLPPDALGERREDVIKPPEEPPQRCGNCFCFSHIPKWPQSFKKSIAIASEQA